MKFKIGDRVSFKDENQTGVVTSVSGNFVSVETVDGFILEVLQANLVHQQFDGTATISAKEEDVVRSNPVVKQEYLNKYKAEADSIAWVILPKEENKVVTGPVEHLIVNNSKYQVQLVLYKCVKDLDVCTRIYSGILLAYSDYSLCNLYEKELNSIDRFVIQMICSSESLNKVIKPIHKDIAVAIPSLEIADQNQTGRLAFSVIKTILSFSETQSFDHQRLFQVGEKINAINEVKIEPVHGEIDLHIDKLIADSKMVVNDSDCLNYQMKTFKNYFQKAYAAKMKEITVIHGIGEGILKNQLYRFVEETGLASIEPASMLKYGGGAALIRFI